jgi:histidine triad (HIT) family protein
VATAACVFCSIVTGAAPAHVVADETDVVAFLDRTPLFEGHTLVVTRRHVETLGDLPAELVAPVFVAVRRMSLAVRAATGAQGTFVAVNNRVSQSVPHLHVHVVPRTKGDGLRGFFWPRRKYRDDAHMAEVAELVRDAWSAAGEGDQTTAV